MGSATHEGAALKRGTEGTDEQLVRVLEETATNKVLEKLEGPLKNIVHEAVAEAIVHAVHAEYPPRKLPAARRRATAKPEEIRRPKEGGRCDAVWRELDKIRQKRHATPALQDILRVGQKKRWNPNNTRVEYYNWRKANGISGRLTAGQQVGTNA